MSCKGCDPVTIIPPLLIPDLSIRSLSSHTGRAKQFCYYAAYVTSAGLLSGTLTSRVETSTSLFGTSEVVASTRETTGR